MNLADQIQKLTAEVGMVPFSDRTHVEVTGSDRATFLHNLCTADIKKLEPGQGTEAFFTNVQGKVIGHAAIFCGEESFCIETVPGVADSLIPQLDRYLITEDVELVDRTREWSQLIIAGANGQATIAEHVGCAKEFTQDFDNGPFESAHGAISIRRVPLVAGGCWSLVGSLERISAVRESLLAEGIALCEPSSFEVLRIENGWPYYGQDITEKNLPQEVCRDASAISFVKGCYLGQETVARIDALGHVNRHLVGLQFANEVAVGTSIVAGDKEVGTVTSVTQSPRLGGIGLGYVRREHGAAGTELSVGDQPVKVVALPMA